MSKTQEALKMALEALEKLWNIIDDIDTYGDMAKADEKLYRSLVERRQRTRFEETGISTDGYTLDGGAITAIREALAEQPAQGCDYCNHPQYAGIKCKNCGREQPAQPSKPWVGLTEEEKTAIKLANSSMGVFCINYNLNGMLADADANLREKNT